LDSLGETREKVAKFVNSSHDTLKKLGERILQIYISFKVIM